MFQVNSLARRSLTQAFATLGILVCICSAGMPTARADTIVIMPSLDTTLVETQFGDLSNGMGTALCVGNTGQGSGLDRRRSLVYFDIASQLPAGAAINSVSLQMRVTMTQSGAQPITMHRTLASWGEAPSFNSGCSGSAAANGDATWLFRDYDANDPTSSTPWTNAGGDYDPAVSASTMVGFAGFYTWSSPGLAGDVQSWLIDPTNNFGWIFIGTEVGSSNGKRFDSREAPTPSFRPSLTIDFDPAAPAGACCFPDGTCQSLNVTACQAVGGVHQGIGSACTPNPCPEPTGACCLGNGSCQTLTESDCNAMGGTFQGPLVPCSSIFCPVELTPYLDPLPIPAVAQPSSGSPGGVATYEIAMTEFQQQLHSQLAPTTVWGYGGTFPGPTIEAFRDQPVTVNWVNDLRTPQGNLRTQHLLPVDLCPHGPNFLGSTPRTVVHLHGGHVPAEFDGYPEDTILPGQSIQYVYPNNQLPATIWYHDHALGITRLNVYLGLAGFYLIRDQEELNLGLPSGEFEVPLVIQDRSFNSDGSFFYPPDWQEHFFGRKTLVNGKVWPFFEVKQGQYRFRLLNGSNSRTYRLSLSNGGTFQQIGSDGGLLPTAVPLTEVRLAPAERADVIVDFSGLAAGTEILLENSEITAGTMIPEVMKFIVVGQPGPSGSLPASLTNMEVLQESDAVEFREFELEKFSEPCAGSHWLINGLLWDAVTEFPVLGTTEVWSFINKSNQEHPMHMHLVSFQVLDRQPFDLVMGQVVPSGPPTAPPPQEAGWKDTVAVRSFEIVRVIARFEDYLGLFAYHCHILEHEDHEMMRQFRTIAPLDAFIRGDVNEDGSIDLSDAVLALGHIFNSSAVGCLQTLDANDDESANIADPVYMLGYLFTLGAAPPAPFPACGPDPTPTGQLSCATNAACP